MNWKAQTLNAYRNHRSDTFGNHGITFMNEQIIFTYHGSPIVRVDTTNKKVYASHCGYHTSSTSAAINACLNIVKYDFDIKNIVID